MVCIAAFIILAVLVLAVPLIRLFSTNQLNWDQGEDMLFVNQAAEKKNTRVEVSKDSIVRIAMPTKHMWNQ